MAKDWDRLARAIREYRDQTGITHEKIAERGGPTSPTITALEAGRPARPATLAKLDEGLGWGDGMALRIANGEDVPMRVRPQLDERRAPYLDDDDLIAVLASRMRQLRRENEDLRAQLDAESNVTDLRRPQALPESKAARIQDEPDERQRRTRNMENVGEESQLDDYDD